jgi:carbonic anhydrase
MSDRIEHARCSLWAFPLNAPIMLAFSKPDAICVQCWSVLMSNVSRRLFLTATAASAAVALPAALHAEETANPSSSLPAAPVKDGKSTLTPAEALELLKQGNEAFLRDELVIPNRGERRRLELAKGQAPFCAYVSCSDSRVPPELLFGRGLGELFIIRNAGNTVDTVAMGSIEYAVAELGVPLVVVMGHESCGAVKAAMAVVETNARFPGQIDNMIEPIIPAVLEARGQPGDATENAVRQNVRRVVRTLRTESDPLLLKPLAEGRIKIVGAYYHIDTGVVEFFDQA